MWSPREPESWISTHPFWFPFFPPLGRLVPRFITFFLRHNSLLPLVPITSSCQKGGPVMSLRRNWSLFWTTHEDQFPNPLRIPSLRPSRHDEAGEGNQFSSTSLALNAVHGYRLCLSSFLGQSCPLNSSETLLSCLLSGRRGEGHSAGIGLFLIEVPSQFNNSPSAPPPPVGRMVLEQCPTGELRPRSTR